MAKDKSDNILEKIEKWRQLRLFDGFDHVGLAASPVVTPTALLCEFKRESYVVGNSTGFLIHVLKLGKTMSE